MSPQPWTEFGPGIDEIPVVHRPVEEELVVLPVTQKLGRLGYAPIVVGIFKSLGDRFLLLVERHVAEGGIFRNAVVVRVGGGGLHRLEGALVVESTHAFEHHVCQHRAGVIADHAPGLAAVERPDREHLLGTFVEMGEHRVGDVCLKRLVDEVEKRVESPVSVP